MGVEVDMTIWRVASVTPPLKNPGYAPALCFPLVSVFTCFDFVYISFLFPDLSGEDKTQSAAT